MAFDFNLVVLVGRLTRDPESRFTQSGMQVVNLSIANNSGKKDDPANFFDCVAFDKTAAFVSQYFKKGSAIMIRGRLQQQRWTDQATGQNRSKVCINIQEVSFLPGNSDKPAGENQNYQEGATGDDIPF